MTKPVSGSMLKAVGNSDMETAKALLEQGADPNEKDSAGKTALHYLVNPKRHPFNEIAALLIKKGADVDAANISGFTPLMEAVRFDSYAFLRFLAENGASFEKKDTFGRTALDWAKMLGNHQAFEIITNAIKLRQRQAEEKAAREAAEARKKVTDGFHDTAAKRQERLKNLRPHRKPGMP